MHCSYHNTFFKHKEAECTKEMMDVKFSTQAKIADASREYQMNKAAFDQEVNTKKAEAELAYELQVLQEMVKLRREQFVQLIELSSI